MQMEEEGANVFEDSFCLLSNSGSNLNSGCQRLKPRFVSKDGPYRFFHVCSVKRFV